MVDVDALQKSIAYKELKAGEVLIAQGTSSQTSYILEAGTLDVLRDGQNVGEISERGAVIGEIAFLLKAPHQASVVAKTDAKVLVLDNFEFIANDHPVLMAHMAEGLARRLLATNAALAQLKIQLNEIVSHSQMDSKENKELKTKVSAFWTAFDKFMTTKIADF